MRKNWIETKSYLNDESMQTIRQIFGNAEDLADFFWRFAGK